jgi:hypothetical protein
MSRPTWRRPRASARRLRIAFAQRCSSELKA